MGVDTDGGQVNLIGQTVLENNITIDTEQGSNSAAGGVDLSGAVISRVLFNNNGEAGTLLAHILKIFYQSCRGRNDKHGKR